jgi:hypothetical protein
VIGSRGYTKVLAALVLLAALASLLLRALGFFDSVPFRDLGTGAALALVGALAWEVVERCGGKGGARGLVAWMAFPAAAALAIGSIPFLALSVYPPLREFLIREGRVEATIAGDESLEVLFPRPIFGDGINLRIGETDIEPGYATSHPDVFRWRGPRILSVNLGRLHRDVPPVPTRPGAVSINSIPGAPRFRYERGETVPPQRVIIR